MVANSRLFMFLMGFYLLMTTRAYANCHPYQTQQMKWAHFLVNSPIEKHQSQRMRILKIEKPQTEGYLRILFSNDKKLSIYAGPEEQRMLELPERASCYISRFFTSSQINNNSDVMTIFISLNPIEVQLLSNLLKKSNPYELGFNSSTYFHSLSSQDFSDLELTNLSLDNLKPVEKLRGQALIQRLVLELPTIAPDSINALVAFESSLHEKGIDLISNLPDVSGQTISEVATAIGSSPNSNIDQFLEFFDFNRTQFNEIDADQRAVVSYYYLFLKSKNVSQKITSGLILTSR